MSVRNEPRTSPEFRRFAVACVLTLVLRLHPRSWDAGLYRVFAKRLQAEASDQEHVEKVAPTAITQTSGVRWFRQFLWREWAVFRTCMFFSLMSACNIGFKEIDFGKWLRLLTRQEFDIKGVGWARVVAGWQSLISVYLLALWVLTYFGRPFE